jgi:recombinational DNA repair protein (RecF pathway)
MKPELKKTYVNLITQERDKILTVIPAGLKKKKRKKSACYPINLVRSCGSR